MGISIGPGNRDVKIKMAKKLDDLSIYSTEPNPIKYDLRVLPLQKEIGIIRTNVNQQCAIFKEQWMKVKKSCSAAFGSYRDQLSSYGITKDSLAVQGGTVGGAMLLGYFFARKRSVLRKILYPSVGGIVMSGAFYFSSPANRKASKKWLLKHKESLWP